jgi:hypothetical protein
MTGTGANPSRSGVVYGVVWGFARLESGEPVEDGGVIPDPVSPPEGGLEEILHMTGQDGSFRLALPPQTYTIGVYAESASGASLHGEVTGVVITAGQETRADIVVTV